MKKITASPMGSASARIAYATCPALLMGPGCAQAHVKWFSKDADCGMQPLTPLQVLATPGFLSLAAFSFLAMMCASRLDAVLSNSRVSVLADRIDGLVSSPVVAYFRYALAAFFCTALIYFGNEPVFLAPELHTRSAWVAPLQAGIALALMHRRSAWLGSLGIVLLYAFALQAYGWFHLLDYPVFLGAAAFIAIDSIWRGRRHGLGLAILRVSAGVTLMWVGVEKWLYPWWSYPIVDGELKDLRGTMSLNFFVVAAGFVEFCAAYALLFGRTSGQVAAGVLLILLTAAVPVFGPLDAIGHAPFIAVLAVLGLTRNRVPLAAVRGGAVPAAVAHGVSCTLSAAAMLGLYWGLQALAYPSAIPPAPGMAAVAVLLCLPLLFWTLPHAGGEPRRSAEAPLWQWVPHRAGGSGSALMLLWPQAGRRLGPCQPQTHERE